MLHVITRLEGDAIYVLKIGDVDGHYALVNGAKYYLLGRVTRQVSVRDGFTVHEWFATSEGDLYQVRAGTRRGAIAKLLERYGMHQVKDTETIPALF